MIHKKNLLTPSFLDGTSRVLTGNVAARPINATWTPQWSQSSNSSRPSLPAELREVWKARTLIISLVTRDLRGRYRGTALGDWWVLLRPLVGILPYLVVFGYFLGLRSEPIPYVLYLLSGFVPWLLFGGFISSAPGILPGARSLITKIYFPRLVIPLKDLLVHAVDHAVLLGLLVVTAIAFGHMGIRHLWALPVFTIMLMMLTLGAGLITATVCALRPDIGYAVPAATRILFYLCPVVYPVTIVPESIRPWYELNPIATLISGIRWSLFGLDRPDALAICIAMTVTIGLLLSGLLLFSSVERRLHDIL